LWYELQNPGKRKKKTKISQEINSFGLRRSKTLKNPSKPREFSSGQK
jgi:hypothetical protein